MNENEGLQIQSEKQVSIQELYKQPEVQLERDQLITFLNQDPPSTWIKEHPNIKGHKYLPIEKVEWMLKRFFKKYSIEVKEYRQVLNSISVCVRVNYLDPISGDMVFQDGVGAWELQTTSGSGPLKLDASNINRGAVPMALGIAKSIAIKDACDLIGNIFGANLNRKDVLPFMGDIQLQNVVESKEHERMVKLIEHTKTRTELDKLRDHLTSETLTQIFETKWNSSK
jgi:hypothetical protein